MPFQTEIPTTGDVSFTDILIDGSETLATALIDATTARSNLRALLKENKYTATEKDYLRIIKAADDYLPYLNAIIDCVSEGELALRNMPVFSWRSTISSRSSTSLTHRPDVPTLHGDLVFTLLTMAYALSDLSIATLNSIGQYEYERTISDAERKAKDERLNFAANLLARASGIYTYISDTVLPSWEKAVGATQVEQLPELKKVVITALAKLAVADANQLAIRKLMTRSAYDSTLTPGPPLPQSHPPTILLAKLYLHAAELYTSAHSLMNAASTASSQANEVNATLRDYVACERDFCAAVGHKWLGVHAGETEGKGGESVAYLLWAKSELDALKSNKKLLASKSIREQDAARKDRVTEEYDATKVFLKYYQKMNDSVHFLPVPSNAEIRNSMPGGRSAIEPKPYIPAVPSFGPKSPEAVRRRLEALDAAEDDGDSTQLST